MDYKKRAISSVLRRKGKSLILFLVVFILGNVIAGAVAIQQSTTNVENETKKKMLPVASVEMDYEAYEKQMTTVAAEEGGQELKQPKAKDYEKISKLSYVKRSDLFVLNSTGTNKFKAATDPNGGVSYAGSAKYMFNIKGYNSKTPLDVSEGLIKITDGDGFTDKDIKNGSNAVLLSQDVAEKNNLSVGDNFVLDTVVEMPVGVEEMDTEEEQSQSKTTSFDQPMKVAGIFNVVQKKESSQQTEQQKSENEWRALEQLNTIYTTEKAAKDLQKKIDEKMSGGLSAGEGSMGDDSVYYQATYVLKNSEDIEAFRQDANALLPEFYHIVASTDQYEQVAGGLTKLNTIAKYIVIIAVVATLLILSLVVLLFLRDRKQELGIYLSFGESRGKVITQIVLELLMISCVALVLSLITGNFLGGAISRSLIQSDWLSNANQTQQYYMSNLMQSDLSFLDIQQAYKVTFSVGYILTYLLVGIGTVLISALLPLLYILRLNPKKIMM